MSRISELPRRDWRAQAAPFGDRLSALLRDPWGQQTLRAAQTGGLLELAARRRGQVLNGRVGIGKTLALALAPTVVQAKRPLFLTLGGILKETKNHVGALRMHWQISPDIVFSSYTVLGNMPRKGIDLRHFWHGLDPDCLMCDEVDRLSNLGAGVTQIVGEWRERCPDATFLAATATLDVEGMTSYAHTMRWALGADSPLPLTRDDVEAWAEVIDKGEMLKASWVCQDLGIPKNSTLSQIRSAYRERLHTAPGVIIDDTPFTGVPLTIESHVVEVGLDDEFELLRTLGQKADGIDVLPDDAESDDEEEDQQPDRVANGQVASVARQYGRGFFHKTWPLPPADWLAARRSYFGWVRGELESGRFRTEGEARAHAKQHSLRAWERWAAIRDSFVPQRHTVWLSDVVLRWALDWGQRVDGGVIWVENPAVGVELSRLSGWAFYHNRGYSASGQYIEDAPARRTIIASRPANSVGRNLQYKWNNCLFMQPLSRTDKFEQAVGRIHREGQTLPVHADVLICCAEDMRSVAKTLASAERTCESIYSQKAATTPWKHVKTRDLPKRPAFGY